MKLSRKHIVYVSLLGLAGLALAVDRFFLGSEGGSLSSAAAAPLSAESAAAPALSADTPASPCQAGSPGLADRLTALARKRPLDLSRVRDAFTPAAAWQAELSAQPAAPADPSDEVVLPDARTLFRRRHELGAIAAGTGRVGAVIDGRFVALGQELDGLKLVRVTQTSAIFQAGQDQVELSLPGQRP